MWLAARCNYTMTSKSGISNSKVTAKVKSKVPAPLPEGIHQIDMVNITIDSTLTIRQHGELGSLGLSKKSGWTNPVKVASYRENIQQILDSAPVDVYAVTDEVTGLTVYLLVDGFHRHDAAMQEGYKTIRAHVHHGSRRDAMAFACTANSAHGERLTPTERSMAGRRLFGLGFKPADVSRMLHMGEGFGLELEKSIRVESMIPEAYRGKVGTQGALTHSALAAISSAEESNWAPLARVARASGMTTSDLLKAAKAIKTDTASKAALAKATTGVEAAPMAIDPEGKLQPLIIKSNPKPATAATAATAATVNDKREAPDVLFTNVVKAILALKPTGAMVVAEHGVLSGHRGDAARGLRECIGYLEEVAGALETFEDAAKDGAASNGVTIGATA